MAKQVQNTWYVSYRLREPLSKGAYRSRMSESFPNEAEAKNFARSKLPHVLEITAGTLNPHLPKRIIGPATIAEWLAESKSIPQRRTDH